MNVREVWRLPCMSQEFDQGPIIRQGSDELTISYDFEADGGDYLWEEIIFTGVAVFAFTAVQYCTTDQVSAYDKLQDIEDSELIKGTSNPPSNIRHYRIFFDDFGCYEILATGFVPPVDLDSHRETSA